MELREHFILELVLFQGNDIVTYHHISREQVPRGMGQKTDQLQEDKYHPYVRQLTDEGITQPLEVEKSSGSPRTLTEKGPQW